MTHRNAVSPSTALPPNVDVHTLDRANNEALQAIDSGARWCYYVPEDAMHDGQYVPSLVVENVAGHRPMLGNGDHAQPWYWGATLEAAQRTCESVNARRGITPKMAAEIVASSMRESYIGKRVPRRQSIDHDGKPCAEKGCGKPIERGYLKRYADICFSCDFWRAYADGVNPSDGMPELAESIVRVNGKHFIICDENARGMRGYSGAKFVVHFNDGRVVTTTNLWQQGVIPDHFRERMPDNASAIDGMHL